MKREIKRILLFSALLMCVLALASCTMLLPTTQHTCTDVNGDTKCDTCGGYVAPAACTSHVDANNDGICDKTGCGAAVLMEMEDVVFKDMTKVYNGKPYTISVKGAPDDAEIEYSMENTQTNAGTYEITAYITADGYEDLEITATLKINPKPLTIEWGDNSQTFPADGKAPELLYELKGAIASDKLEVKLDFGGHDFNETGSVTVTATVNNPNYRLNTKTNKTTIIFGANVRTVSFDTGIEGKELDPEVVVGGEAVDEPRALSKYGHNFLGWYNGETLWNFDDPVTEDMTLTAKWALNEYKITYHLNGGTNSAKNPATFTIESDIALSAPEKEGAIFMGWFIDKTFSSVASTIGDITADMELYAKWSDADFVELVSGQTIDNTNNKITLSEIAVNGAFTYTFAATIKEFPENGAIYIGRGKDSVDGSYAKINGSGITVYSGDNYESRSHIRAMEGYIFVELRVVSGKVDVIFYTGAGDSSTYSIDWSGRTGAIFFEAENVSLENASFGWYTSVYDCPTWIIGDKTIGSPENTSITTQLSLNRYRDYLAIGASSLTSDKAFEQFKNACEVALPNYAIWSFRTDTSETYDETMDAFVAFCKEKGIVPILTTQISTLDFDNTARNEKVKASGERYIDFASMGEYEGVLNANKEYTVAGAEALLSRFMADFPEIVAADATMRTVKADTLEGVSTDLLYIENYVAGDDVTVDDKGNVTAKYTQFRDHRLAGKNTVLSSAITMNGNAIKDGKYMIVSAKIDGTLEDNETIMIGHGYMTSTGKWIEINGKDIWRGSYQSWGTANTNPTQKEAHKLTIKNYITVVIACDSARFNRVTIYTDGASKSFNYQINGNAGDMFVSCAGLTLTDVTMSWTCADYAKDIWVFGDSYLSLGDPARWPTHLRYDDYYTALMVGASGMSAEEGLANLEDAIQYGKPKYIVWLEGMNNSEKKGRNSGYHESVARLFEICEEYGIMPIIATIPNCAKDYTSSGALSIPHEIKNAAIYNGTDEFEGKTYRIIDWAAAVENFTTDTVWHEGMLHTDYVHPTNLGAKALYMQLAVDFPEIMGGTNTTVYREELEELKSGSSATIKAPETLENNKVFAFGARLDDEFKGTISIGNGKGVEGGTWVEIDKDNVTVYQTVNGTPTEILKKENKVVIDSLINLKIHVKGDTANVSLMSVSEIDESCGNRVFNFDVTWSSAGDAFVSTQGNDLRNVKFSWFTFKG